MCCGAQSQQKATPQRAPGWDRLTRFWSVPTNPQSRQLGHCLKAMATPTSMLPESPRPLTHGAPTPSVATASQARRQPALIRPVTGSMPQVEDGWPLLVPPRAAAAVWP